jgi:hypothetical protein
MKSFPEFLLEEGFEPHRLIKGVLIPKPFDNFFSTQMEWSWMYIFLRGKDKIVWGLSGEVHRPPTLLTRKPVIVYDFDREKKFICSYDIGNTDNYWNAVLLKADYHELLNYIL